MIRMSHVIVTQEIVGTRILSKRSVGGTQQAASVNGHLAFSDV